MNKSIAIIGGGAAGCFCAIILKELMPQCRVSIYEAKSRLMSKLAITGGGRCNLTNNFNSDSIAQITNIESFYPRGYRIIKRLFNEFSPYDTIKWFENQGVKLVAQADGCIFPMSQNAMEIVSTLQQLLKKHGVNIILNHKIEDIRQLSEEIKIITIGGKKTEGGYAFIEPLGINIEKPCPSLFTFELDNASLNSLSGTVVGHVALSIPTTKFRSDGILLLTDWGISGPATLKLSSYAARFLDNANYTAQISINWLAKNQEEAREIIQKEIIANKSKKLSSIGLPNLTSRLWAHIISRADIREDIWCSEIGPRQINRLSMALTSDIYQMTAKGSFKDEFVTCGGVSLKEIESNTLRCKKHPDIYFAGEVLDIDAITGGFNLQAAWTTAYAVAKSVCS